MTMEVIVTYKGKPEKKDCLSDSTLPGTGHAFIPEALLVALISFSMVKQLVPGSLPITYKLVFPDSKECITKMNI